MFGRALRAAFRLKWTQKKLCRTVFLREVILWWFCEVIIWNERRKWELKKVASLDSLLTLDLFFIELILEDHFSASESFFSQRINSHRESESDEALPKIFTSTTRCSFAKGLHWNTMHIQSYHNFKNKVHAWEPNKWPAVCGHCSFCSVDGKAKQISR